MRIFAPAKQGGAIAQLVEQRTENPCVPGSIPGGTTPPFISPVRASGRVFFLPSPTLVTPKRQRLFTGQRIFPVGGREYQEYSVIFAQ